MPNLRTLTTAAVFLLASSAVTLATLIGINSGLPNTTFANPSSLSYTAATGVLTLTSTPTATRFDWSPAPVTKLFDATHARSLSITVFVHTDGTLSGGGAGDDLVLRGIVTGPDGIVYDGTGATPLLTGEVDAFGYQNGVVDLFDFRFHVTGGLLAGFYQDKDIGVSVQSDNGNTFVGNFTSNFAGNAKGNLGPIARPVVPCTGSIGDFVWHDENRNGIQDVNEHGINGVLVTLTPTAPAGPDQTVLTSNSPTGQPGYYQFGNLCGGDYSVSAATPDGTTPTTSHVGPADTDSNGSPASVTLVGNGASDQTIDFGFQTICTAAIGDFVWSDTDGDGVQDAGEPGVNGVIVQLLDADGNVITSTLTTNSPSSGQPGYYNFDGRCAGAYQVRVVKPAGFDHLSAADQGGDDSKDSDANPLTGIAPVTLLADNTINLTIDFGLVPAAPCSGSIGDFVWNDLDGDGLQGMGEPGLNGVLVELKDGTTVVQQTYTTTHNGQPGYYRFTGLSCSGNYQVWVTRPAAYARFSPAGEGSDETIDSNGQPTQADTYSVATVALSDAHHDDDTIDFGFYSCSGAIGDFVWKDLNGNGVQDSGEPGIPNVTLLLQDGNGQSLGVTAQTDANGFYQFTGLCAGNYTVVVLSGVPSQLEATASSVGSNRDVDSNGSPAPVTLTGDFDSDVSIDFGYKPIPPAALGDFVWEDANRNGVQDAGEPGIRNVTVSLFSCGSTTPLATTLTNTSGLYQFTDLLPGSYAVRFDAPSGYFITLANQGVNDAADSDADASGQTACVTLVSAETNNSVDAGMYRPAALGDFVWSDLNANGQQNAGEPGIANVLVQLFACGGTTPVDATLTGADGSYLFSGLVPGCYFVRFGSPAGYLRTAPNVGNDATDSDADATTGQTAQYTLVSGQTNRTVDAGLYQPASICGFVYVDLNNNGIKETGEPPIAGVTVSLSGTSVSGSAVSSTTTTAANGRYCFLALRPGTYTVTETQPAGFLDGLDTQGTPGTGTSGNDVFTTIALAAGVNGDNNNFGELRRATYTTFTMGGWGSEPSGNNPGELLRANFTRIYPTGVTIGGGKTLKFTSQLAIQNFLPADSTPGVLKTSRTNPLTTEAGVFAGQVLSLKLNYDFSVAGLIPRNLGLLRVAPGNPLAGSTVAQVLSLANSVLGGGSLPSGISLSTLNTVVASINGNYDNGTQDNGFLVP